MNYYELLQVNENASEEVIKMAYKALMKKYHPDAFKGDKAFAEEMTKEINKAYDTLSDPIKRREYDSLLKEQRSEQGEKQKTNTRSAKENTKPAREEPFQHKKRLLVLLLLIVVILSSIIVVATLPPKSNDEGNSYIKYESYYVGVRTITLEDKNTAELIIKLWKKGEATENSMKELMDEYATEQGGGQLYMIERGWFVEEIDEWCFDRSRQIGDVAIIENEYGYSICYFSSVKER